jgi:hypothetical protein
LFYNLISLSLMLYYIIIFLRVFFYGLCSLEVFDSTFLFKNYENAKFFI